MGSISRIVMVAEDEALIRLEIADALTEAGFEVLEASHAEEALTMLQARHGEISVLFTDIHMHGAMDGLALAHNSENHWPWIGLLVASGLARPGAGDLPPKTHFLTKPYHPDAVIAHVKELAGMH